MTREEMMLRYFYHGCFLSVLAGAVTGFVLGLLVK